MVKISKNQNIDFKRYKRHKISKCYFCGWTNNPIRPVRMIKDNVLLTVSACKECISKFTPKVACIKCGEKLGQKYNIQNNRKKKDFYCGKCGNYDDSDKNSSKNQLVELPYITQELMEKKLR
jgi:hypothetical protein